MSGVHQLEDGAADATAIRRVRAVRAQWLGVRRVSEVVADTAMRVFHAGPSFRSPEKITPPMLHSIAQAALFEGWFGEAQAAIAAVRSGLIRTAAAQDVRLVVPLAGVLSASMQVLEIGDAERAVDPIYSAINEGPTHATRLGRLDADLNAHLHWLNGEFARWLEQCVQTPLALFPLIEEARQRGDDCHASTKAGSELIARMLSERCRPRSTKIESFLALSPAFALNFWMGAAALCARAGEGVPGASLVTRAGGNGLEFGIQLAGNPGIWHCIPAPRPIGVVDAVHLGRTPSGALGDSAVIDFCGLGGQSLANAPTVRTGLAPCLPADALLRSSRVLADGTRCGEFRANAVSAARCVAAGLGPLILIGMIDSEGEAGRVGGGVIDTPVGIFAAAIERLPGAAPHE